MRYYKSKSKSILTPPNNKGWRQIRKDLMNELLRDGRGHPIFKGMHSQYYLWKPVQGEDV